MSVMQRAAEQFFEACETGKGWEGCAAFCHPGATFSAQADVLGGVDTVEAYAEWMKVDGDKIRHMTKIWNDVISLKQLGWA